MNIDLLLILPRNFYPVSINLPEDLYNLYKENEKMIFKYMKFECEKRSINMPPSGFSYTGYFSIASLLEKNGFNVQIFFPRETLTFKQYIKRLWKTIKNNEVKVVGIGPYTFQYPTALAILRYVKTINPNIFTVIGGHHATFLDDFVLKDSPTVDFVIRGEGEWVLKDLLSNLNDTNKLNEIRGITYRTNDKGGLKRNPDAPLCDIRGLPPPAYHLLPFKKRSCGQVFTSRGCPYCCVFCSEKMFWKYPRYKSPNQIVEEISLLVNKYGVKHIRIADDTFTLNPKMVSSMNTLIHQEDIDIKYLQIWTRGDRLTNEIANDVKNLAATVEVCLGIESASNTVLKIMNKNQTIEQNISALKTIRENDMIGHGFWILGHPGSNVETERHTTKVISKLIRDGLCMVNETSLFTPYPGSPVFSHPEKFGVKILTHDWSKYCENPPSFPPVFSLESLSQRQMLKLFKERYTETNSALASKLYSF